MNSILKPALAAILTVISVPLMAEEAVNKPSTPSPEAVIEPSAPPPETVISSDRLEMKNDGDKSFFLFSDNVKMTGNNLVVTCDRLEVHADRTGDLDSNIGQLGGIQQILAIGNVSISQEGRVARAGRAEVLPIEDKIILTENPIVMDEQGSVSGETMTFYRGERRAVVDSGASGPARVVLPAIPDLGFMDEEETEEEVDGSGEPADTPEETDNPVAQP